MPFILLLVSLSPYFHVTLISHAFPSAFPFRGLGLGCQNFGARARLAAREITLGGRCHERASLLPLKGSTDGAPAAKNSKELSDVEQNESVVRHLPPAKFKEIVDTLPVPALSLSWKRDKILSQERQSLFPCSEFQDLQLAGLQIDECNKRSTMSPDGLQLPFSIRVPEKAFLHVERLVKAIAYEGERGFANAPGRITRFGDYLSSEFTMYLALVQKNPSRWSQKILETLMVLSQNARNYDTFNYFERYTLMNMVSQLLGFESVIDLIEHQAGGPEGRKGSISAGEIIECLSQTTSGSDPDAKDPKFSPDSVEPRSKQTGFTRCQLNHPFTLHPAIVLGSSERIELFVPLRDTGKRMNLHGSSGGEQAEAIRLSETHTEEVAAYKTDARSESGNKTLLSDGNACRKTRTVSVKRSEEALTPLHDSAVNSNWMLDTPMSLIKCLTKDNRSRLEKNGIHTLRMLLQHFPRTYVNYEQAGQIVEDGRHLTFFGNIVSCRGIRYGASLGGLEVIIKSVVDENSSDSTSSHGKIQMEIDALQKKEDSEATVFLHLKKFFRGSRFSNHWFLSKMASKYPEGVQAAVSGKVKALPLRGNYEIRNFYLELLEKEGNRTNGVEFEDVKPLYSVGERPYPLYPAKGDLQPKAIEYYVQRVLPSLPMDLDPLPEAVRENLQLVELRQAYLGIHSPKTLEEAKKARHRLVFDEFFYLQLAMLYQKQQLMGRYLEAIGIPSSYIVQQKDGALGMEKWSPLPLKLVRSLPFKLTNDQRKVVSEIMWDLRKLVPMNRLLQGDVGCGKTIVAFLALLEVIGAGYQGAFMAPTEFLANQHYERILSWLEVLEEKDAPRVALLTGSTTLSKARAVRRDLELGNISLVVGTHSLISDTVKFSALALAVIDEQHRFGVGQRERFNSKASVLDPVNVDKEPSENHDCESQTVQYFGASHVLMMSATPIPRSLALALHGDMSLSQITEVPPGRPPTRTYTIYGDKKGREAAYKMVLEELEKGGQVFVVYPVIEVSEELPDLRSAVVEFGKLSTEFKNFEVGLVHGRLKVHEKEEAMNQFREGKTQLLISTTVIEVGVDIPEASMIVVEHAERYGMAQLHQLRGRVGRGSRKSSCILLSSFQSALNRLKLLEASRDGFYLAEEDLKHRGPGDLLGKRQSGYLPEFTIARLEEDGEVLEKARKAAEEILEEFQNLDTLPRLKQELSMRRLPGSLS